MGLKAFYIRSANDAHKMCWLTLTHASSVSVPGESSNSMRNERQSTCLQPLNTELGKR